jgi:glycosyltransferase involved in cell wall biosynthesis
MKPANPTRSFSEYGPDLRPPDRAPKDVAVLIPAYQPGVVLETLIACLVDADVPAILLVDDGSPATVSAVFDRLAHQPRVHLLRHARNQGKGCALKTGMQYFLDHLHHYSGLVTADADGQHNADDIVRVARALHKSPRLAILGARNFRFPAVSNAGTSIPLRALLGNRLTAALFRTLTGIQLTDAQTGLRALPASLLPGVLALPGRRYEFEMSMLLYIARTHHPLAEQPIRTLYDPVGGSSHFRLIADSVLVLRALFDRRVYRGRRVASRPFVDPPGEVKHTSSVSKVRAK